MFQKNDSMKLLPNTYENDEQSSISIYLSILIKIKDVRIEICIRIKITLEHFQYYKVEKCDQQFCLSYSFRFQSLNKCWFLIDDCLQVLFRTTCNPSQENLNTERSSFPHFSCSRVFVEN